MEQLEDFLRRCDENQLVELFSQAVYNSGNQMDVSQETVTVPVDCSESFSRFPLEGTASLSCQQPTTMAQGLQDFPTPVFADNKYEKNKLETVPLVSDGVPSSNPGRVYNSGNQMNVSQETVTAPVDWSESFSRFPLEGTGSSSWQQPTTTTQGFQDFQTPVFADNKYKQNELENAPLVDRDVPSSNPGRVYNSDNHVDLSQEAVTAPADSTESFSRFRLEGTASTSWQQATATAQGFQDFPTPVFAENSYMQNEPNYVLRHNYCPHREDSQNGVGNYSRYHPYQHQQRFPQGDRANSVSSSNLCSATSSQSLVTDQLAPRGPKKHQCTTCNMSFTRANHLKNHVSTVHKKAVKQSHKKRNAVNTRREPSSSESSSSGSVPNLMAGSSGEATHSSESSGIQGRLSQQQVLPLCLFEMEVNHQISSPIICIQHPPTHVNSNSPMSQQRHESSTSPMMGGVPPINNPPPMRGTTMPHQPYSNGLPPHVTTTTSCQDLMDTTSLTTTGNDLQPHMQFTQEILPGFGIFNVTQLPSFPNVDMNLGYNLVDHSPEDNIPPPDRSFNAPTSTYDTYGYSHPEYETLTNTPQGAPKEELNPNIKRRKNAGRRKSDMMPKEQQVTSTNPELPHLPKYGRHKCHPCHEGDKEYKCVNCPKQFHRRTDLKRHMSRYIHWSEASRLWSLRKRF